MRAMAATVSVSDGVREFLVSHGYHLFLTPDRPTGWQVAIRSGKGGVETPVVATAPTREEAIGLARRLFVSHRLTELDELLRAAGVQPPAWNAPSQDEHLAVLQTCAREHGLA